MISRPASEQFENYEANTLFDDEMSSSPPGWDEETWTDIINNEIMSLLSKEGFDKEDISPELYNKLYEKMSKLTSMTGADVHRDEAEKDLDLLKNKILDTFIDAAASPSSIAKSESDELPLEDDDELVMDELRKASQGAGYLLSDNKLKIIKAVTESPDDVDEDMLTSILGHFGGGASRKMEDIPARGIDGESLAANLLGQKTSSKEDDMSEPVNMVAKLLGQRRF